MPATDARRLAEARGRRAETIAAWWLRLKGYSILGRRVQTPLGEIDLIAVRAGTLVFVEVKARAGRDQALLALNPQALHRVARAARLLAGQYARRHRPGAVRIDAVLVVPGRWPRHIEAVWREAS
ncbi:MAG: YraN family protein [Polymorphobacter sp.]